MATEKDSGVQAETLYFENSLGFYSEFGQILS